MRTKIMTPTGVEKAAIAALALVFLAVLAPGALGAADDPFEVFPGLRANAGFSCQDLKFSGEGTVRSLGLVTGTAGSGQGHLRSNADIILNGAVEVDGNVLAGPNGRVRLNGGPIVTGIVANADVVLECHPIDLATLEAALDQNNDNHLIPLTVLGEDVLSGADGREFKIVGADSITLPAGSYIFSSFEIGGGSTVEVDGEVRILVTGDVKITGGGVFNQSGSPFLVRLWSSGETFRIESQSILGGFVYAPAADSLVTGGAELRGAIYTAELDINGGGILTRIIDDAAPQLAITSPSDGDTLTGCEVEVVGTAMDGETDVDLTINGIPVVVEDDGSFSTVTSLWTEPHGLITATATDGDGNTTTVEIQVTVLPPVVTLELPPPGSLVDQRVIALAGSAGTATEVTVNGISATVADGVWQIAAFDLGEDGLKTLVMIGANCGGDGTSTAGLDLDTTPPVVAFTDPPNGRVIGDTTVTVTGTVIDAHLESVEVNGISAVIAGDTFSVANVPLVEGINTLTATAIDGNALTSTAQLSITVDTLAPVVEITAPSDGGLTTVEPITVVGGVTEANLESLTINGVTATVTGGQFSAEIGLVEGSNDITATATDVLGRTGGATITIILDTTAPGVTITEPVNGSVTDAVSTTVSGSFTEVLSSLTVNGLAATFADGVFSVENVPLDAEGDNFIIAAAADLAGNSADSLPTLVVRDTLAPTVTMDTTALPALTESATLIVTGTATDPHLESVTVAGVAATIAGDQWTVELTLAEGATELVATAEDSVGHSAQTPPFTVVLDTAPPVIEITSPTPGSLFSVAAVTVEGTVSDPNLDDAAVVVNGETATVNGDLFTVELVLAEGETNLVAQATDLMGHVGASSPVDVIVDTLAPVVTLTEPLELLVSTATVEVTGTVTDPHLEQVTVNGVAATIAGDQFTVTGVPLVEGSNLLTATATDTFGHSADSNAVEFILDSTVPEIAITAPPEGELIFDATVTVTGTVADVHLESVEVNGHPAIIDGGVFTAENVPLIEGTNVLTAVARDSLDLIASASVTVVRDSSPPAVAIVEPALGSCVPAGQPITVSGTVFSFNLSDGLDGNPPPMLLEVTTTDGVTTSFIPVITADGRSWSVDSIDVGSADGTAIITATANDIAGRTGVAAASLRVDATPPVLTLLLDGGAFPGAAAGETPPPGTQPVLLNRVVAARVSVADGAFGAPEANLTLDGLAYVPGTPIDAEGDHLLVAAAIDCAGHPASVHALFSIDLTAPTLVGTTPTDGEQLTEGPAAYSGSADTELASATINGSPAVVAGAGFNLSPISWREGDNAVEIVLTDLAGNQATFQRSFSVSTIEPTVEILDGGLPIPDAAIYTRPVTPEVRATPADATIDVTLDGAPFILGAALDATGDYTLVAIATDGFGRTATDSVSFRVDLEAGPTIAITTPVDGAVLTEASALVNGTVSGSAPTVTVNGLPAVVTGGAWTIADLSLEPDVLNLISAIATDSAGRTASATVSVMVRTGGGQVLILEPVDGASTNRATIDVVGAVVGGADRTVDGTVTVNGIVTPVALDGSFRTLDVPLASGANLITAEVTDPEDRTDTDTITVHTDLDPPAISLAADGAPLDEGAVFTHPVILTITISDNMGEPPPPIVTLNGNPQPADAATVAVPVTTDGGYLLAVTAFDAAGNERRAERSFTITGGGCGLADLEPADGSSVAQPAATIRGRSGSAESVTIRVPIPDTSPVVYDDYTADLADGTFVAGGVPLPAIGDNALEIVCTGAGGATAVEALTIHRLPDGDGPAVEITSPAESEPLSVRTITVAGTVSEATAAVTVNGRSATVTDQGDGSGIFTVDLPLTEGPNVLAARALDAVGRAGADRVIVWLDTRAPPVTITSPENNSWHGPRGDGSAVVDVSGLIDIDAEPNLVDVVVSTTVGSVTATVDPDTGDFLATGVPLDAAADPSAIQTVTVTAADSRGHTETAEIGVHFDAAGPAIVLVAPPDLGRYHEGSPPNLTVSGEAWAAEGSSVSINGATIDPTILTWDGPVPDGRFHTTFSLDILRATDEGPVGVIARITQLDGRWAGTRRLLFVDATPPEILEIHPADGSEGVDADSLVLVLFSEPILHSSLSSAGGLSLTRLDTGDPVVGQLAVSGTAVAFVPGAALAPSVDYRFSVGAGVTDLVGHPIAVPQEVVFSTAADAIATAPQLDPALPSVVCASSLSVTGTAAPNTTVRVRDGDLSFTGTADPTGAFTVHLPLTGDGFHVIEVAAVDRSGTAGSATTSVVRVDCSGPQVDLASLDITNSLITLELSEAVDPVTATIGFSGAAIRLFDDNDPAAGDQQATVQLSPDGATIELLLDSAPDAWWRDTVIRLVVAPPLADDNGIVMGAPFETLLFPTGGGGLAGGFLFGETYDDTTGRPLEGATAHLYLAGSALPGAVPAGAEDPPLAFAVTDARGRYQITDEVAPGRYTFLLEAGEHVRVVRQLSLEPATGTIPFDSRLTPMGDEAGVLDPVAGGTLAHPDLPLLQLVAQPAAVDWSTDLTVHLVPRSGQGLPDALPLGWTPLAAADLVLTTTGDTVLADGDGAPFALNAVHLDLPLPDWVVATDQLVAVRYHLSGGQWLTVADVEFLTGPDDAPIARVELVGPGSVSVVLPDAGDGAPPLPALGAGNPLRGVGLPDAMPELTATLTLDPPVVPPTGRATASVVALSADGSTPWPSGLAVQAYLEEQLILSGGVERIIEAPYVADLLLYRSRLEPAQLDGNDPESAGAVDFVVSPSDRAAEVLLDVGYENIRLYPFPGQLERGQILGPGGGTVTSADGVELSVPEGALPSKTIVQANQLAPDELAALPAIVGYDTIAAVRVELGGHTLARAATLSLDVPAGAPDAIPGDPRLILAELIEAPADGRGAYPELTARIDRSAGRLTAGPETPDSGLAIDGVRREGLFLVLHAQAPMAYATGLVTAANGFGIELARVTNDGLGTADLSALGGRYAIPIQASPGTIVEAAHPASDESGSAVVAAVSPGEVIALDIVIVPVAPAVVNVFPDPGVYPVNLQPSITFTEPLNPATVGPGTLTLVLADAVGRPTATRVAGTVTLDDGDTQIIFTPSYPLAHGRQWVATFTGGVTDAGGTPYADGPVVWNFSTTTELAPGGQVHPELFHIRLPVDGVAEVYGDVGAVPSDAWSISPFVVREVADPETITVSASATGAFSVLIGEPPNAPVTIDDEVWVRVLAPNGDIETFRLDVFAIPGGRGFVAPTDRGTSFTTVDGITVEVPEGAFDVATAVTVTPLDPATVGAEDDLGLGLGGYLDVDFEGTAAETLVLKLPAPADIAPNAKVLIGEPVNLAWGRRLRLIGVGGILEEDGESFLSNDESVQPPIPDLTQGNLKLAGDTDIFLGLEEAGSKVWYYEVDPLYGGGFIALATFLADNQDSVLWGIFASGQADMWVFQGPPENWSGQVVLPVTPGTEFTVEHRDAATGWLLSSQDYGTPVDPDGDGVISLSALLPPDPGPPRLVDATPFDLIRFAAPSKGSSQRLRLDLQATTDPNSNVRLESPQGFELSQDAGLALFEVSDPAVLGDTAPHGVPSGFVCWSSSPLGRAAEASDDLLAVVGPGDLDPDTFTAFSFTFSRSVDRDVGPEDVLAIARLTEVGDTDSCDTTPGDQLDLELETAHDHRTILLWPSGGLALGKRYKLQLFTGNLFVDDCPHGPAANDAAPCASPKEFYFTTRKAPGSHVAQGGGDPDYLLVTTTKKIHNLFFSGTVDGKVLATDLSGGSSPTPGVLTHHAEMVQGAVDQVRAFATDGHGRLFLAARFAGTWGIKAVDVEEIIETTPNGTFEMKPGGVRTSYALGSQVGTLSEFMAMSALPLATPVDLDILARDHIDEPRSLDELCALAQEICGPVVSDPDEHGFYDVTIDLTKLPDRPEPYEREDSCEEQEDTDRLQRITLENLSTGQFWSGELLTDDWIEPPEENSGEISFRARAGDQLRLRYNLQTLGFVALLGSGVTVVDLNRFYDTEMSGLAWTGSQCNRRLGKYEGNEIDFDECGSGGLRYGIDMTTAVGVLGPTGCDGESCSRGPGQLHVYSPLINLGLIHSQAAQKDDGVNPGELGNGTLTCTADVTGATVRDLEIARGVTWLDRGLRSTGPGQPFSIQNQERFDAPVSVEGDLLFLSMGEQGVYVFSVAGRYPELIGILRIPGHTAFKLQVETSLGYLFAGGYGDLLDVWNLSNVNTAPIENLGAGVEDVFPAAPVMTLRNVPWFGDELGVDLSGTGLLYSWSGSAEGVRAVPLGRPPLTIAGVFASDDAPDGSGRELRPTGTLVPLGVPTELSLFAEHNRRSENEKQFTAAFKVRMALPGFLGGTLQAHVEGLQVRPPEEHFEREDLGQALAPAGGEGWPEDSSAVITLRRLVGEDPDPAHRFEQTYNLYESDEIVLLLADPRALDSYVLEGTPENQGDLPDPETEAGQCRRCERPEFLTEDDDVVEVFAGGPYLRVILDLDSQPALRTFFNNTGWPVPGAIAELAGWADDIPSPRQVALAEPVQNPAMWSEEGVTVSLVSGETVFSTVDHVVPGRALGFSFERSYRSGMISFNPLGKAGWTSNYFAHLRENLITGEVAYHDGNGNVWRFISRTPPQGRELPGGTAPGDFWARASTYDTREGMEIDGEAYLVPRGLPLLLERFSGGWKLLGIHNESQTFDNQGRLVEIADRLRQHAEEDQEQGNRVRLYYDAFDRLYRIEDEYGRDYTLRYFETTNPDDPNFGLLEEIEDFAGRKLNFGYNANASGERVLDRVELPTINADSLIDGPGRPVINYTFDPIDYGSESLVHGPLKGTRLAAVRLPGRTNDTVSIVYKPTTGQVHTVSTPRADNPWSLEWHEDPGDEDPTVTVKSPWELDTEYYVAQVGRIRKHVAKNVETVDTGDTAPAIPTGGGALDIPTADLTTSYIFTDSGLVGWEYRPDGSALFNEWRDENRLAEGTLKQVKLPAGTATTGNADYIEIKRVLDYSGGADNIPGGYSEFEGEEDEDERKHTIAVVKIDGQGTDPLPALESHESTMPGNGGALKNTGDPLSIKTTVEYNAFGLPTSRSVGQDGVSGGSPTGVLAEKIWYSYSQSDPPNPIGSGYLKATVVGASGVGLRTEYSYDDFGSVSAVETKDGSALLFSQSMVNDEWGRPFKVTSGQGGRYPDASSTVEKRYDPSGRLVREQWHQTGPGEVKIEYNFDSRDRLASVTYSGLAGETPGTYVSDVSVVYNWDSATGLLQSVTSPGGVTETYVRDAMGRPKTTTPGGSGPRYTAYDSMGRPVWQTDGDDGAWRGKFDAWGRLFGEEMPDGTIVLRAFDLAGALRREEVQRPAEGPGDDDLTLSKSDHYYTSLGQPWLTVDYHDTGAGGELRDYSYDSAGRLTSVSIADNAGVESDRVTTTTFMTDATGRVDTVIDPFGNVTDYDYTGFEPLPSTVKMHEAATPPGSPLSTAYDLTHDAQGRVVRTTRQSDGRTTVRSYDEAGNLTSEFLLGEFPQTSLWVWDAAGRLVESSRAGGRRTQYGYDLDGQLRFEHVNTQSGTDTTELRYHPTSGRLNWRQVPGRFPESFTYNPDDTLDVWTTPQPDITETDQLKLKHIYDSAGRLVRRYIDNPSAFSTPPDGLAPFDEDLGDAWTYDRLGRETALDRVRLRPDPGDPASDSFAFNPSVSYVFGEKDPRALPETESIGLLETMWGEGHEIRRAHGVFGDLQGWNGPGDLGSFTVVSDNLLRRASVQWTATPPDSDGATYSWGGAGRLHHLSASSQSTTFAFGGPGTRLGTVSATFAEESLGQLGYHWDAASELKTGRSTSQGANGLGIFDGGGWSWGHRDGARLRLASSAIGDFEFDYANGDELLRIHRNGSISTFGEAGPLGRPTGTTSPGVNESFGYDDLGRRTSDSRYSYTWSWRGELVQVEVIDPDSSSFGHRVEYTYDAVGRLSTRKEFNATPSFERGRLFIWNDAEFIAMVGLNWNDEPLWKVELLPGPNGLDDALQLRVTPTGAATSARTLDLFRNEMGSVVAVFEDKSLEPDEPLPLKGRLLYSPYGEAFLERGPILVSIDHDLDAVEVGDVTQEAPEVETLPDDTEVLSGMPGSVVLGFTMAPTETSLAGAVRIERFDIDTDEWVDATADFVVGLDEESLDRLLVMPPTLWGPGVEYRIWVESAIQDAFGRSAILPGEVATYEISVLVPDPVPSPAERLPGISRSFPIEFDTSSAARAQLDCAETAGGPIEPCMPGGMNFLFQGLWHDPLTGIAYARNRWYDARTAHWLSPDPMGAFDSPNQYAFVAWGPHMRKDPTGELWSAAIDVGFAAWDTYQYLSGNISGAQYSGRMALTGAALLADAATGGMGGGLAVRATALAGRAGRVGRVATRAVQAAQWTTRAENAYNVGQAGVSAYDAYQTGGTGRLALSVGQIALSAMGVRNGPTFRTGGVGSGGGGANLLRHSGDSSRPYILFNRTHSGARPSPRRGTGPGGGRLQSHHPLQREWAEQNLGAYGYKPRLAPTVTLETGRGFPHSIMSARQGLRRNLRVGAGQGKWSSTIDDELAHIVGDFRAGGFNDKTIQTIMNQQYRMLDKLGVPYMRPLGF